MAVGDSGLGAKDAIALPRPGRPIGAAPYGNSDGDGADRSGFSPLLGRRRWLAGAGATAIGMLLGGCGGGAPGDLTVLAPENAIPGQLLRAFRQATQARGDAATVSLKLLDTVERVAQRLQDWQRNPSGSDRAADWRSWIPFLRPESIGPVGGTTLLGQGWLALAQEQGWLQPWFGSIAGATGSISLGPRWEAVVRAGRSDQPDQTDRADSLWGIPYRWGTTALVYRPDKFAALGWEPQDWSDLWRPELRGKVMLLDRPREVIGLTLKRLGHSYNHPNPQQVDGLAAALTALNAQTLIYGAEDYIQPVLLGDAWVAVGWSNELVTALGRQRNLKAVVPRSGTALWADLWVRPAKADRDSETLAALWAGLAWQPAIARELAGWVDAAPAAWLEGDRSALTPQVQRDLLLPSPEILERCEFIQPLAAGAIVQYQALWQAMRQPVVN